MTLDDLANKHGSDKGTLSQEAHGYCGVYESIIQNLKHPLTLLEIGIWDIRFPGASCRMWKEYLSDSRIIGMDINPLAKSLEGEVGIEVMLCDQTNPEEIRRQLEERKIGMLDLDLVIDDGSHLLNDVGVSLRTLWPYVSPGGVYVVEDMHFANQPRHSLNQIPEWELDDVKRWRWEVGEKLLIIEKNG